MGNQKGTEYHVPIVKKGQSITSPLYVARSLINMLFMLVW